MGFKVLNHYQQHLKGGTLGTSTKGLFIKMATTTSASCIGKSVSELETPCFLVDLEKVTKNCQTMKETCKSLERSFRPVTNTHRTLEGAELQTVEKKKGIMCRSLQEVGHLANNGFDDILFGFPLIKAHMPCFQTGREVNISPLGSR